MNEHMAQRVAAIVDGKAVNSGGNVFIVEIRNAGDDRVLCLGNGGWWLENPNGTHVLTSDDFES
jgi:hypothetical protein